MTIAFKDGRYFLGMWFVSGSNTRDWLCAAYRDGPTAEWEMKYRFRYYADDKKGDDSEDTKNWYHATMSADTPEEKILAAADTMANALVAAGFGPCLHRDIMRSDRAKRCVEFFERNPDWAHMSKVAREEAEKTLAAVKEFSEDRDNQKALS